MAHPTVDPTAGPYGVCVTRVGQVPTERYGQAHIEWLAGKAASEAKELMVGITTIDSGGGSPMHRHPNCEEVLLMLAGEIEQVIEGQPSFRMKAGDAVTVPRNVIHRAINVGAEPARMVVIFSAAERETILVNASPPDAP